MVFVILIPVGWVGLDVGMDPVMFRLVPDDVLVVISLPDPAGL